MWVPRYDIYTYIYILIVFKKGVVVVVVAVQVQILRTINSIRSKDPRVYLKDVQWFQGDEGGEEGNQEKGKGKKEEKKKTFKDVVREQAQAAQSGRDLVESSDSSDDSDDRGPSRKRRMLAYDKEQAELRKAFMNATEGGEANDDHEEEGFLRIREKSPEELAEEAEAISSEVKKMVAMGNDRDREADRFLQDFVLNKRWVDPDRSEVGRWMDGWTLVVRRTFTMG